MKKKILIFILFSFVLSSCAKDIDIDDNSKEEPPTSIHIDSPTLVTSLGQSIDYIILEGILDNLKIEYTIIPVATLKDIEEYKTIIAVVGSSKKGLKFSGITTKDEMKRIESLYESDTLEKLNVILLHMGGKNRRGIESDEIIKLSLEVADSIIVVDDGNFDNIFSDYAVTKNIIYKEVAHVNDLQLFIEEIKK